MTIVYTYLLFLKLASNSPASLRTCPSKNNQDQKFSLYNSLRQISQSPSPKTIPLSKWMPYNSVNIFEEKPARFDEFHSSISHKKNYIAIAINNTPIGIDLETIEEKDPSLLKIFSEKEYHFFLEQKTTTPCSQCHWKIFYHLWTAKEALIKKLNLELDNMKKIHCTKIIENKNKRTFSDLEETNFSAFFEYKNMLYCIRFFQKENFLIAITSN